MNADELNALKARLLTQLRRIGAGHCADVVERQWRFIETKEAWAKATLERERFK